MAGGSALLLKNDTIDDYVYTKHVFAQAEFTLHGAPGTLEFFAKSSCQVLVKAKKNRTIWARGPWHCVI